MFSMTDKRCHLLPPIPELDGIPDECNFVPSDGKIYLLAAGKQYNRGYGGVEVYVLDLARQRHWKQCASMPGTRQRFGCGAVDGKVYIFGGVDSDLGPLPGSEVSDSEVNAWSPIMPLPRMRTHPFVDTLGDELFVNGGTCYHPDYATWYTVYNPSDSRRLGDLLLREKFHPWPDEWRLINPFETESYEIVFRGQGHFYAISPEGINVFGSANKSWKDLHSHSFTNLFAAETGPIDDVKISLSNPVVVNDELLAAVSWYRVTVGDRFETNKGVHVSPAFYKWLERSIIFFKDKGSFGVPSTASRAQST